MKILVLNSDSGSRKASRHEIGGTLMNNPSTCLWEEESSGWRYRCDCGGELKEIVQQGQLKASSCEQVVMDLLSTPWGKRAPTIVSASDIDAVEYGVVHGGSHFGDPIVMTPRYTRQSPACPFASLYIRAELAGIKIVCRESSRLAGGS